MNVDKHNAGLQGQKNMGLFSILSCSSKAMLVTVSLSVLLTTFSPSGLSADPISLYKKEIPQITLKNLSPPYKNYVYFQNYTLFPFESEASSFSQINAWWLAEISTLVYADEAYVRQRFKTAGLDNVRFFDQYSTQCFIAASDRFAVVAFRGSEIWKRGKGLDLDRIFADLATDFDVRLSPWPTGGRVHRGFERALEEVWDEICPVIRKLEARGLKIWMTGHSLGGALAILAAGRYRKVQGVYTYGAPRIGDRYFRDAYPAPAYRIVNGSDLVTHVPGRGVYRHVGVLKFIDTAGILHQNPVCCDGEGDTYSSPNAKHPPGLRGLIPPPIRDHVPLLYSVFLWNSLLEHQGWDALKSGRSPITCRPAQAP